MTNPGPEISLVRGDVAAGIDVLHEVAARRRRGEIVDLAATCPDDRTVLMNASALELVGAGPPSAYLAALDALGDFNAPFGGQPWHASTVSNPMARSMATGAVLASRAIVVPTWEMLRRVTWILGRAQRAAQLVAPPAHRIGRIGDRTVETVVVIPGAGSEALVLPLVGALATGWPVVVAGAVPAAFSGSVQRVERGALASALQRAAAVVALDDLAVDDVALLAGSGIPVCAPSTLGADLWFDGVEVFAPWSRLSASAAVEAAIGAQREIVEKHVVLPPLVEPLVEGPSVTVLVRTLAHPAPETVASIARQTYASIAVAAAPPGGQPPSLGTPYVLEVGDGDVLYADAIAQLVTAAENADAATIVAPKLLTVLVNMPGTPMAWGYAIDAEYLTLALQRVDGAGRGRFPLDAILATIHRYPDGSDPLAAGERIGNLRVVDRLPVPQPLDG